MSYLQWRGAGFCLSIDIGTLAQEKSRDLDVTNRGYIASIERSIV